MKEVLMGMDEKKRYKVGNVLATIGMCLSALGLFGFESNRLIAFSLIFSALPFAIAGQIVLRMRR